ncbi:MAG: TadE/TadG family type IV pilus assembly protein [Rhodospirillales bacterium]
MATRLRRLPLKPFLKCESGSPAIDFAFAAPVMFTMLIAILEVGMVLFVTTLMEGGLRDASRYGITGAEPAGSTRMDQITAIVADRTIGLVDLNDANIQVLVYPNFGSVGTGEDYIDGNGNGLYGSN